MLLVPAFERQRQASLHSKILSPNKIVLKRILFLHMCVHVSCVSADAHVPCHACGSQRIFLSPPSILVYKCWDYRCVSQHCTGYLHPRDQTFRSQLFLSTMAPGDWIQVVWHARQVILITKPFWLSCTNLKKNYFDFMCLHVKAYMFVCAPHVCLVSREARRGRRSSWDWSYSCCEPPCVGGCWALSLGFF